MRSAAGLLNGSFPPQVPEGTGEPYFCEKSLCLLKRVSPPLRSDLVSRTRSSPRQERHELLGHEIGMALAEQPASLCRRESLGERPAERHTAGGVQRARDLGPRPLFERRHPPEQHVRRLSMRGRAADVRWYLGHGVRRKPWSRASGGKYVPTTSPMELMSNPAVVTAPGKSNAVNVPPLKMKLCRFEVGVHGVALQ